MTDIPSPIPPRARAEIAKITELSGENIYKCMQCGTCSSVCPMNEYAGFTTRRGIHLLQLGRTDDVIAARLGELCAACHTCTVRCPRGIDVAKVYEAVRLLRLRENEDLIQLSEIPKPTFDEAPQIAFVSGFRKLTP
jgi:heterodisulfide reductase subunit C